MQVTNIDNKEITFVLKQKSNDTLLIQIIDNGIGIEKDNLKRSYFMAVEKLPKKFPAKKLQKNLLYLQTKMFPVSYRFWQRLLLIKS